MKNENTATEVEIANPALETANNIFAKVLALQDETAKLSGAELNALFDKIGRNTSKKGRPSTTSFIAAFMAMDGGMTGLSLQRRLELSRRAGNASPFGRESSPFAEKSSANGASCSMTIKLKLPATAEIAI